MKNSFRSRCAILLYVFIFVCIFNLDSQECIKKKIYLDSVKVNYEQFLRLLDSLVQYEKRCNNEYYNYKFYWVIVYEKEHKEGFFMYAFLTECLVYDIHDEDRIFGYFKLNDEIFLISKKMIDKNIFILSKKKKKLGLKILTTPSIEDFPEWSIYYSYRTQRFYILNSYFVNPCK